MFLLFWNEQWSFEITLNSGTRRSHRDSGKTNKVVDELEGFNLLYSFNLMKIQCDKVHCHDAESWLASHEHLFSAFFQEYNVINVDILSVLQAKLLMDRQTANHQRLRKRVFVWQASHDNWLLHHANACCLTVFLIN